MTLIKYHEAGKEYLIFDPSKNTAQLTPALMRSFCCRNFGINSNGILVGPIASGKRSTYKLVDFSGNEVNSDRESHAVFEKYLNNIPPNSTIYYFDS